LQLLICGLVEQEHVIHRLFCFSFVWFCKSKTLSYHVSAKLQKPKPQREKQCYQNIHGKKTIHKARRHESDEAQQGEVMTYAKQEDIQAKRRQGKVIRPEKVKKLRAG
jgi:hypothetical protein